MAHFNISGSDIRPDNCRNVTDLVLPDPADDTSPLISYSPVETWTDLPLNGTSAPFIPDLSYTFLNTGTWFFGAKRPGYGPSISNEGQSVSGNAQPRNLSLQQLLGGRSGLTNGPHTAVFTNTSSYSPVDHDPNFFETRISSANASVTMTTTDNASPAIEHSPTTLDWALDDSTGAFNDTLHTSFTQTGELQAQFAFDGDGVSIYATVLPDHANYTVTVDGVTQSLPSGSNGLASSLHTGVNTVDDLTPGPHNLTLTTNPAHSSQNNTGKLTDTFTIGVHHTSNGTQPNSAPTSHSPGPHNLTLTPTPTSLAPAAQLTNQLHSSKRLDVAVIGGVIAGVLILLLLPLAIVLLRRRLHVRPGGLGPKCFKRPSMTPHLPIQTPPGSIYEETPSGPNPCVDPRDPEKGIGYSVPVKSPFTDDEG
ncbi:hypothetical protein BJV74DRAFT_798316 [Russula compacta]|nr:hypothetical protein BJV74DRAFT_798316 [Russula compacta]